jgi:Flp pilus assembly protein TadG
MEAIGMHNCWSKSGRSKQSGVAAVEFAILFIPLIFMAFGMTEYGRALYEYDTLAKSARNAARFLTTQAPGNGFTTAQNLAVYGNELGTGPALAGGLTTAMVSICDSSFPDTTCPGYSAAVNGGGVNLVSVTINGYPFVPVVSLVNLNFGLGPFNFGPISVTMHQES